MTPPILVSVSGNEVARPRFQKIKAAIEADERFAFAPMGGYQEPPFDLQFISERECPQCHGVPYPEEESTVPICGVCIGKGTVKKTSHVELKDFSEDGNSDYLGSILNGHLWEQVLAARERQEPFAIVVLGDDNDVGAAIRKAASRPHGRINPEKLLKYFRMVEGFEANCIGINIQVWRLKTDPYKRMLIRVRKILEGGDLSGFAPAPPERERQAVGLSILAGKGIGPTKAAAILKKFRVGLIPLETDSYLSDCGGIGEKLADRIVHSENIWINGGHIHRPKTPRSVTPRKSKAKAKGATA